MTGDRWAEWTEEWPTEPGSYWFYGWHKGSKPWIVRYVRAIRTGNKLAYCTELEYLYPDEDWAYWRWQRADVPEPPPLQGAMP